MYGYMYVHVYMCVYVYINHEPSPQLSVITSQNVYLEEYAVEFAMLCIIILSLPSCMHILYPRGLCSLLEF